MMTGRVLRLVPTLILLFLGVSATPASATLLTFNSKYVVISSTPVTSSSTTRADDTEASQTFTLAASQTVVAMYNAFNNHGSSEVATGKQIAISVDGTDRGRTYNSPYAANGANGATTFWIGTLAAGSHTIKGRFASNTSGSTVTIDERILLILILDGDEFYYIDSGTAQTTTSATLVNDPNATQTFTPSGACKALILYSVSNNPTGTSEDQNGKYAAINLGGTDYSQLIKSPGAQNYSDNVFTLHYALLSATSYTAQGRFASRFGATVTISRRQLGVLLFADSTLADYVGTGGAAVSTTSLYPVNDTSQALIARTTTDARELLVVATGSSDYSASSATGLAYGIQVDTNDRTKSRTSPRNITNSISNNASTAWAEMLTAGPHTVRGRYGNNTSSSTVYVTSRRIVALWFVPAAPTQATQVYYAVGQSTSNDLRTGTPTCTVSGSTITFSTGQTDNRFGVGCKVTYGGSNVCYISGKISSTVWSCTNATGGTPTPAGAGTTVDSIRHAFASLNAAVGGASPGAASSSYLSSTDLIMGNYVLNIPCYYDTGADTTAVTISAWTTGSSNYIKIYTPNNTSTECNQSQRHNGMWADTKYRLSAVAPQDSAVIDIQNDFVRIEGLQVYMLGTNCADGILANCNYIRNGSDVRISHNIVKPEDPADWSYGIDVWAPSAGGSGPTVRIWNNIVYNYVCTTGCTGIGAGANCTPTLYVYNNTVYNCTEGYSADTGSIIIAKNNIAHSNTNDYVERNGGYFSSASDYNLGQDAGPSGDTNYVLASQSAAQMFVDPTGSPPDFHIKATSDAYDAGTDLSSDPNLAFSDDIDGHGRGFGSATAYKWDIGADEYVDGKFEYKRKITLNCSGRGTSCGAGGLSNFPVLIDTTNWPSADKDKLKTVPNTGHVYRSDGGDIIFRDSSEVTQLPHEIEKYDGSTGTLIAWVKVDPLFNNCPATGTDIYIYYGNAGITSPTRNATGVWDSNYVAVYHLNQDPSGSVLDSTGHANLNSEGTMDASNLIDAKIGKGIEFIHFSSPHYDHLTSSDTVALESFTLESWAEADNWYNWMEIVDVTNHNTPVNYRGMWSDNVANIYAEAQYDSGADDQLQITDAMSGFLYHVVTRYDSTTDLVDGYLDGSPAPYSYSSMVWPSVTGRVDVGAYWDQGGSTWASVFRGYLDEVRISNIARTDCWIETSYNTMNNPGTFVTLGPEGAAAPTVVTLKSFTATQYSDGALLRWKTGYEVNNLGFHIYREENGQLVRLTPEPVAGSALLAGSRTALTAGHHYHWWDSSLSSQSSQLNSILSPQSFRYWLEDIDLSGKRTMHGPVTPVFSREPIPEKFKPELLSEVGWRLIERYDHYWRVQELKEKLKRSVVNRQWSIPNGQRALRLRIGNQVPLRSGPKGIEVRGFQRKPDVSATAIQQLLAGRPAVKLLVREEGWYRVSQSELAAAGLSSKINPRFLQLYVDGKEQPIRVTGKKNWDAIEFYGMGLDTPSTDTRVYWLIEGTQPGKRIDEFKGYSGSLGSLSFPYTVEVKDRWIYLPAIKNGEEENFFGAVVYGTGVDQLLHVQHLDLAPLEDALLEVVLQGATNTSHRVKVLLNREEVGELVFEGQSKGFFQVEVPQSLLLEDDNLVSFIPLAGDMDVSLVDTVKLTYWHTYTADDNSLRFTAQGGNQLSIGGFGSSGIRVFDITEPTEVIEVSGRVQFREGSYAVSFRVPETGQRTVLALTGDRVKTPEGITSNHPSSWHQVKDGYDLVIVTHRDFLDSLEPLKKLRESQGLKVALIEVEDLYDEFSFGNKSPKAIKDFLGYTKTQWQKAPRFVVLVGDASFDPKNYFGLGDHDFVPTKLIDTTYLETASDDWFVDFNNDGLPEMGVGRLPVQTVEETAIVVSKILGYEKSGKNNGALLVADKSDNSDDFNFEGASEEIWGLLPSSLTVRKIYRSQFSSDSQVNGVLLGAINQGPLLVNFIGHGSIEIWRGNIFTSDDAEALINGFRLPFFVNMTCLNGYFQDPYSETLGEALIKAKQGGAIAVWTSSGLTEPDKQAIMNKELIRLLFGRESLTLGEATAKAKAATGDQDIRKTWILFGDPTTRLK